MRLGAVGPAGVAAAARAAARRRSSRPVATSRSRRCSPRGVCGSRACCGRATSCPGRSVRFVARLASVLAVSYAETAAALDHRADVRHRHPDPVARGRRPGRGARAVRGRPGERILLVFGGSQAVRRINDAVARRAATAGRAGARRPRHGRRGVRRGARRPGAAARRPPRPLPAARVPPRRRDDRGAGGRRPGGRAGRRVDDGRGVRVRAADGDRARTRTRPATSGATPSSRPPPGRRS